MQDFLNGLDFIAHGGFMMIPLLISALIGLSVIFERLHMFKRRFTTDRDLLREIFTSVQKHDLSRAHKMCDSSNTPITAVLGVGIEHFNNPLNEMELAMKNRAEEWVPRLEKRIDIIDTVITAAPLMGLLGTIVGMMESFRVLSTKGVNEPNAITGGVAEALVATATGIVIALICLVAYNYLTTKVKHFIYEMESMASRLVEMRHSAHRTRSENGVRDEAQA